MLDLDPPIDAKLVLSQYEFGLLPDLAALNELRTHDKWVSWRYFQKPGRTKPTKPPVNPHNGKGASHSDPTTWGSFAQAVEHTYRRGLPGVGFVLTDDDGYTGFDLDDCVDAETGEIEPWAQEIIDLAETYTEVSPSGTGLRLLARGKADITVKVDAAHVEIYRSQRYLTISGRHVETTPDEIQPAPRTYARLLERVAQFDVRKAEKLAAPVEPVTRVDLQAPRVVERTQAAPPKKGDFFRNVNDAALLSFSSWVPAIFPSAKPQPGTNGYRVSSADLGRDLQEDVSFVPSGIVDYGVADQGDANEGRRTAIDIVMEYSTITGSRDAALWLCERMGKAPELMGFGADDQELAALGAEIIARMSQYDRSEDGSWHDKVTGEVSETPPLQLDLTPTVWACVDPKKIPQRKWLYGHHIIRKFLSTTVAPGGLGKSSLLIAEAISLATGRSLLVEVVHERCRVWLFNGEDPYDELQRRIAATCIYFGIDQEELVGWLYVDTGRETKIVIATEERSGAVINRPIITKLEAAIRIFKIDVVIIDPFVKAHRVNENDNTKIDMICEELSMLADRCNCAIELVHHVRKSNDAKTGTLTVDDARGAGALLGAVRSARVLNRMSDEEANEQQLNKYQRLLIFRVDNGKSNLSAPTHQATWRELVSVSLGNGIVTDLVDTSDKIAVVKQYEWHEATVDITDEQVQEIRSRCMLGEHRYDRRSKSWIGQVVADVLDLDTTIEEVRKSVATIIDVGIKDGWLETLEAADASRKLRTFVKAGARTRA